MGAVAQPRDLQRVGQAAEQRDERKAQRAAERRTESAREACNCALRSWELARGTRQERASAARGPVAASRDN